MQSRTSRCAQEPSAIFSSSSTSPSASNQFQAVVRHSPSSSVEKAAATSPRAVTMATTDINDIDSKINIVQLRPSNVQPGVGAGAGSSSAQDDVEDKGLREIGMVKPATRGLRSRR